jgi:dolichyl-phosphate-mannose--protein O-mannosyl transferase
MWPFGGRTVNYRSDTYAIHKEDGKQITEKAYMLLQKSEKEKYTQYTAVYTLASNPFVLWLGVLGVYLALVLVLGGAILHVAKIQLWSNSHTLLLVLLSVYIGYMAMASVGDIQQWVRSTTLGDWIHNQTGWNPKPSRLLYMYHYLFGSVMSLVVVSGVLSLVRWGSKQWHVPLSLVVLVIVAAGFYWFAPFAYGFALTEQEYQMRNWLQLWALKRFW